MVLTIYSIMIRSLFNTGITPDLNIHQMRVIQMTNMTSVAIGIGVLLAVVFNRNPDEAINSILLMSLSLLYFSVILWNKWGYWLIAKVILGFSLTTIPFLNLVLSGRVPEGQFLSILPAILTSFCCFLFILDRRTERALYYFGVAYYLLYASVIDQLILRLSVDKPDLSFIESNYFYYKFPMVLCMILLVFIFQFFKNILLSYEQIAAQNQALLESKNAELLILNESLEVKVEERTSALRQTNKKLIDLAFITAHEIRGPLTSIMGATDYFLSHPKDKSLNQVLPELHARSKQMDEVITKMVHTIGKEEEDIRT